jgi:phosphopantothenoylcysteine decarboxylase/phosphopantothenate--cysteine ligase
VAAVADYRPARALRSKIRREEHGSLELKLERNVDILAELSSDSRSEGVFRVGFAAEDADLEVHAAEKLARKKLDAIVANDIRGGVFGSDQNEGVMFFRTGERLPLGRSSKRQMADRILDAVKERLR